ncbi:MULTISPECIES: 2'-5' RNA ligase family protein [unclassified Saccharopolyspora]|uniref:2'-5' RNA ligase family protein n=1 Tax=unclassified Saccharopolyspora TaxID=2646250 RepID=UPI001CD1BA7E|nr:MULTISPECIES: 2'-5' RNA ligase family protein [unclassified Saccharopolyspora]MCA1193366.1 RNA 2',3'-cyclic phosphodiesterase [Saccharopolyspora sp. 6V]MCA1282093.1 RNA 2',3'-cyclic phosphodiesterase [Saccharopolyspora sp. 7B]
MSGSAPPRLFTAVRPPPAAVEHLAAALGEIPHDQRLRRFRRTDPAQWHLTLCFHGPTDPAPLAAELDRRVPAAGPAPRLRLAGAGTFRGVLWIGVETATDADTRGLHELVRIAGGDPGGFRAHLTVARWNAGLPDPARLIGPLSGYAGPWWAAAEVELVRSDPGPAGSEHRVLHVVPVPRRAAGDQGGPFGP